MIQDTQNVLAFSSIAGKKLQADFNGGSITSDGGVLFLSEVESRIGVISRLVQALDDRRHPSYVDHSYELLMRQRVFQISCGYEDANDCNTLRGDPAFKAACQRAPLLGQDLGSQSTMSRLENAPRRSELYRMAEALIETFVASYPQAPDTLILDIDDTADAVHGGQQQCLFNSYYDTYCFLPLHLYEGQSGKLITSILRPGRRPTGAEIVSILKRVVGRMRRQWPEVALLLRGDSHFRTPEVHQWCESESPEVYYIVGQSGNKILNRKASALLLQAQALYASRQGRAEKKRLQAARKAEKMNLYVQETDLKKAKEVISEEPIKVKLYTSFFYQAKSWLKARRILCKVEVSAQGNNIRFVATNLENTRTRFLYEKVYCGRGQMENYIKDHKLFLHSDRTSCHKFAANQFRLFLHSAAYMLMHALADTGLKGTVWCKAQCNLLQNRIVKVGARVEELRTKVVFHFPSSFPLKDVYAKLVSNLALGNPRGSPCS